MSVMVQSGEQDLYDLGDKGYGFIYKLDLMQLSEALEKYRSRRKLGVTSQSV